MEYRWYKNGRMVTKSGDINMNTVYDVAQEYYDDHIDTSHHKGDLDLYDSHITSLGKLETVEEDLDLYNTKITSLGKLETVGGYLDITKTKVTSLGNLRSVRGDLYIIETNLTSLGKLEHVGGRIVCNVGTTAHKLFMDSVFKKQVNGL